MARRNSVNRQGEAFLREASGYPMFETAIRDTCRVTETTYAGRALEEYAPKCTAAQDYRKLAGEYLAMCGKEARKMAKFDMAQFLNAQSAPAAGAPFTVKKIPLCEIEPSPMNFYGWRKLKSLPEK